jgi:hypothetical protein
VGGVAKVVECLPSKYEVLSSKPRTTKKKNNGMAAQACAEMIELYTLHDYVMIELHR